MVVWHFLDEQFDSIDATREGVIEGCLSIENSQLRLSNSYRYGKRDGTVAFFFYHVNGPAYLSIARKRKASKRPINEPSIKVMSFRKPFRSQATFQADRQPKISECPPFHEFLRCAGYASRSISRPPGRIIFLFLSLTTVVN